MYKLPICSWVYYKLLLTGIPVLLLSYIVHADSIPQKTYVTRKVLSDAPVIDGVLDDQVWNTVEWAGDFIQLEPYEAEKPSQPTSFKILYDDNNVYVAIRAEDSSPEHIEKRLTRRDQYQGDWVSIEIDSYNDNLTAFSFAVSAAGVKNDGKISNENDFDKTPDPVWYTKTSIDDKGWNAEMKIPLTQLRFSKNDEHVWGIQVVRWLFRKEELSTWQYIPKESARWVGLFGDLRGIHDLEPKKEVELIPYLMGNMERFEQEEGNPFATGTKYGYSAGLDGKIAVSNDFTLNFTVNPDFGQVEADPSDVNLTAFETFFQERRPFFVEGSNIFDYRLSQGGGPMHRDNLFYSRRIGRRPQHSPDTEDDEYLDSPEFTSILGAFKISGKTRNGWSVGIMESVTNKEIATIGNEENQRNEVVEPLTNYFNTRLQKDYKEGNTIVGGMFTATNRKTEDESIDFLHHSAYTGGLDFQNYWQNKTMFLNLKTVFSHMIGNTKSITELQESARRYYQRPDANHLSVDTNRTTLTGNGGTLEGGKIGGGHWRYSAKVSWQTPGLELNDMGFMRQADIIHQLAGGEYDIWEPFSIFRSMNVGLYQWSGWDFSGLNLYLGSEINFHTQFKNYWSVGFSTSRGTENISRHELRGGPALRFPGDWNQWFFLASDERKKLVFEFQMFNNWGDIDHSRFINMGLQISYRPVNSLMISVEPGYTRGKRELQYVETVDYSEEERYIISTLNSERFSTDFRINFSVTPDLSFQYWGQPFVFAGDYSTYKRITEPMHEDYHERFHIYTEDEIFYNNYDDILEVDENQDGNIDYSFDNPNFNFFEFRSNFVARWEYIPGSTIYFVWSQGRTGDESYGKFNFREDLESLYSLEPHNIFLLKISYRISM